ncbi:MAG TPA: hypothetical protein VHC90_11625 [Bryobacteraceae bacterium]|nr:hypothetical protein [Bryobacteraceae bacterium]
MIVRIRFGQGRVVTQRKGKNSRAARLLASLLTLVAISFAIFGFWRLGQDLDILGDFVFTTGLLSHWQVWIAAAAATQYAVWRLARYSKQSEAENSESNPGESSAQNPALRAG